MSRVRCKYCKKYNDKSSSINKGLSYYCSDEHYVKFARIAITKNRRSTDSGPTQAVRYHVLMADSYKCRLCSSINNLHIHHVKYRSEGGKHTSDNLITLCLECHEKVHSNKKKFQSMCQEIVEIRESYYNKAKDE